MSLFGLLNYFLSVSMGEQNMQGITNLLSKWISTKRPAPKKPDETAFCILLCGNHKPMMLLPPVPEVYTFNQRPCPSRCQHPQFLFTKNHVLPVPIYQSCLPQNTEVQRESPRQREARRERKERKGDEQRQEATKTPSNPNASTRSERSS